MYKAELLDLSKNLIGQVRSKSSHQPFLKQLCSVELTDLLRLTSDSEKLSFWINIYNAHSLILQERFKPNLQNRIARKRFFTKKEIRFLDLDLSLDDIEHKIIRQNRIWWSFGYLKNPFPKRFFKKLMVQQFDPRIHFALNCGASSCPPVRHYSEDKVFEQLDLATKAFILGNSSISNQQTLETSSIFKWYKGDFSGRKGIISIHKQFLQSTDNQIDKIHFLPYEWT
jgi:hypothetical protein